IALGHDLGHTPFGHAGEAVLNRLMSEGFHHVVQSVRVVEVLENQNRGLNLTREVVDGIARHSKGRGNIIRGAERLPSTLEGQLVRISDIIAYVNHDTDDALRGGVLRPSDIPARLRKVLGHTHSQRIARAVKDIIRNTNLDHEPKIMMSEEMEQALLQMRDFLWDRVYDNPTVHDEFIKCQRLIEELFHLLCSSDELYLKATGSEPEGNQRARRRAVCDFIAGMTDRYAIGLFKAIHLPMPWPVEMIRMK
ncbi:MAG: HD domain-containing protein, partial [Deltaproteobacteria bacterium]